MQRGVLGGDLLKITEGLPPPLRNSEQTHPLQKKDPKFLQSRENDKILASKDLAQSK